MFIIKDHPPFFGFIQDSVKLYIDVYSIHTSEIYVVWTYSRGTKRDRVLSDD